MRSGRFSLCGRIRTRRLVWCEQYGHFGIRYACLTYAHIVTIVVLGISLYLLAYFLFTILISYQATTAAEERLGGGGTLINNKESSLLQNGKSHMRYQFQFQTRINPQLRYIHPMDKLCVTYLSTEVDFEVCEPTTRDYQPNPDITSKTCKIQTTQLSSQKSKSPAAPIPDVNCN